MNSLYTTITNTTDPPRDLNLTFLPPHGRSIPASGSITIFGDVRVFTGANAGSEFQSRRRDLLALEMAVESGDISIAWPDDQASVLLSTTFRARDTNVALLTVGTHTLLEGDIVSVSGVGGTGYNGTVTLTAVAATTVSYASPGDDEVSIADTDGRVYRP